MSISLEQLKQQDENIHAFLGFVEQGYIDEQTAKSQERIQAGKPLSAIDGKTIAIKDNFVWEKGVSTGGSKILEDFKAPYTATAVQKIIDAGGIIVGKTNLDEFGMGSSTENSAYGPTKNPHDLTKVPGGSSGGSAAAVSAGMVNLAIGSDTGGSIRQPAAFCGVVGFKPTYGAVSRYGLMAYGSSLDTVGPFAKTVKEAKQLFDVIAGKDAKDATSIDIVNSKISARIALPALNAFEADGRSMAGRQITNDKQILNSKIKIQNLRIGIPKEFFGEGLDPRIKSAIDGVVEKLKSQGAKIMELSLPTLPFALACYYIIAFVEVSSNLARYDGVKYGFSIENSKIQNPNDKQIPNSNDQISNHINLLDVYMKSRAFGFGAEAKRRIMLGTYTSSAGYVDQYYNQAQKVRQEIKKEFDSAFNPLRQSADGGVDFIFAPVTPTLPFKFGENTADPVKMYLEDVYTVPINVAGIPALSLPIGSANVAPSTGSGQVGKNLPIGMQILGPQKNDYKVFEVGEIIESLIHNS